MDHVQTAVIHGLTDPTRWLSLHHDAFWMSYQPASRFWIFQGVEAVVLIGLAVLFSFATVRCIRGRARA
jgi:hypothetical protein